MGVWEYEGGWVDGWWGWGWVVVVQEGVSLWVWL